MGGRGSGSGMSGGGSGGKSVKLPQLKGSERQIAWANQIRRDAIATADRNIEHFQKEKKKAGGISIHDDTIAAYKEVRSNLVNALQKIDSASVIIDKRHIFSGDTVIREADKIRLKWGNQKKKR